MRDLAVEHELPGDEQHERLVGARSRPAGRGGSGTGAGRTAAGAGGRGGQGGQAVLEFALVAPVLMLLAFGIVQFGLVLNAQLALTQGVREGAQLAAFGAPQASVQAAVAANAPTVQNLNVRVTGGGGLGSTVTVTATGDFPVLVPDLPGLGSAVTLSAAVTEAVETPAGG